MDDQKVRDDKPVVVDYLRLMSSDEKSESVQREVSRFSRGLRFWMRK